MWIPSRFRSLTVVAIFVAAMSSASAQRVHFVDAQATGKNDGSTWKDAYTELRTALAKLSSGEIWISRGVYKPAPPTGPVTATFLLKKGISLYGGFRGGETRREQRDPLKNPCTLSGDLKGDDNGGYLKVLDNVQHVVTAQNTLASTVLDGLRIEGGSTPGRGSGAGIQLLSGSLTLRSCRIERNRAVYGAGVAALGTGTILIEDCVFYGNRTWLGRGAGLYLHQGGAAVVRRTRFERNQGEGGGSSESSGAGIYVGLRCQLDVSDSVFARNRSLYTHPGTLVPSTGAGITALGTFNVRNCRFYGNDANSGGALFAYVDGTVSGSVFYANRALRQNNLGGDGGALMTGGRASVKVDACVFHGNSATESTGGLWATKLGTTRVTNSIFWMNRDRFGRSNQANVKGAKYAFLCVDRLLVTRPGEDPIDPKKFPGSFDKDPQFAALSGKDKILGNEDDEFGLLSKSPCIDAGDPASTLRGLDMDLGLRLVDGNLDGRARLDIGAVEYQPLVLKGSAASGKLTLSFQASKGLFVVLVAGTGGKGLWLPPLGELFVDASKPLLVLPLGLSPKSFSAALPAAPFSLVTQGLGVGTTGSTFSRPLHVGR